MDLVRKYIWVLVGALVVGAGFFFFYTRFYRDVKTLTDFSLAYEKFQIAITDFTETVRAYNSEKGTITKESVRNVEVSLAILQKQASKKISSLIRNDAEFMRTTLEIAAIARKEYEALTACYVAVRYPVGEDKINGLKEVDSLKRKRQEAYIHFQELVVVTKGKGHL